MTKLTIVKERNPVSCIVGRKERWRCNIRIRKGNLELSRAANTSPATNTSEVVQTQQAPPALTFRWKNLGRRYGLKGAKPGPRT